jgi:hypothetical protein
MTMPTDELKKLAERDSYRMNEVEHTAMLRALLDSVKIRKRLVRTRAAGEGE